MIGALRVNEPVSCIRYKMVCVYSEDLTQHVHPYSLIRVTWVKVVRIIPEFRILRLTFNRKTHVRKQPIIALYFEFEIELKFYNLKARSWEILYQLWHMGFKLNPLYTENPKRLHLQSVKNYMKNHIMRHFIRVCTVC